MTNYLLAGGGTAGHVNPLLALADLIRATDGDANILVLGTREGLEVRLVPERGYVLETIERLPFPRKPNLYALGFPARYQRAIRRVRTLIKKQRIDVVVGFGGYASAPAYRAAFREHLPFVIHEANAKPGLANRLGARDTSYVGVTFAGTPLPHARVTGMPLRPEIVSLDRATRRQDALAHFGLRSDQPVLLVTGGSLGARAINEAISRCAGPLTEAGVQVLHIWGGLTELEDPGVSGYTVLPYCDRMDLALAACDLAVSRAGSTTVSELAALGVPAVLVPYGHGNGEQRLNARELVASGGALLREDRELTTEWVQDTLISLVRDRARLDQMAKAAQSVGRRDGTERLFALVREALAER